MPPQVVFSPSVAAAVARVVEAVVLLLLMSPDRPGMLGLEVAAVETTDQRLVGVLAALNLARKTGGGRAGGWVTYLNKCWLVNVLEQVEHSCRWRAGGRETYEVFCKVTLCSDCTWKSAIVEGEAKVWSCTHEAWR